MTGVLPQPDDQVGPLSLQDGQGSMQGRAPMEESPTLPAGDRREEGQEKEEGNI